MEFFRDIIYPNFNYWVYVILMMIGMHAMIVKNNLIKKLIGMTIFQTAIILFYVSIGVKSGATIPILEHAHGDHHGEVAGESAGEEAAVHPALDLASTDTHGHEPGREGGKDHGDGHHYDVDPDPNRYANPLPHVLMLTAIVVGVSTLGVALAISQSIFRDFKTLEEDEILTQIKAGGPTRDA